MEVLTGFSNNSDCLISALEVHIHFTSVNCLVCGCRKLFGLKIDFKCF